ncbi:unnamed protein product [Pleuronectes platessa]|uniref:Uncharacterized protein n=1 Tax=Pleuronectes platessa TaxID=8262 RepID=A0A9N7UQY0_PLEPL|nr:unnamed protein product [Pleuronectes platessa]
MCPTVREGVLALGSAAVDAERRPAAPQCRASLSRSRSDEEPESWPRTRAGRGGLFILILLLLLFLLFT